MSDEKEKMKKPPSSFESDSLPSSAIEDADIVDITQGTEMKSGKTTEKKTRKADGTEIPWSDYTRGVVILATEDFTGLRLVENFSFEDVEFKPTPGMTAMLVKLLHDDIEQQQLANVLLGKILNEKIPTSLSPGQPPLKVTLPLLIAMLSGQRAALEINEQRIRETLDPGASGIIMKPN